MRIIRFLSLLLIIVGALNWGLWGFFQYDFVADIFGGNATAWARIVYSIIGLAGLYGIRMFFLGCVYVCHKKCEAKKEEK